VSESTSEPVRTKRQAQAEARREQILAVALDVFAEKGVTGSTVRDIAREAGITEGLIYHYFPSKSALVEAVIERNNLNPEILRLLGEVQGVPVREALVRLGRRYLELLDRNRKYVTMVHTAAQHDPDVARVLGEFMATGLQAAQRFMDERVAAGELRPHDTAVSIRLLHHCLSWIGTMQYRLSPPFPPLDRERFVQDAIDMVLAGIAP
jgi:AcrR family transcriptional regulator